MSKFIRITGFTLIVAVLVSLFAFANVFAATNPITIELSGDITSNTVTAGNTANVKVKISMQSPLDVDSYGSILTYINGKFVASSSGTLLRGQTLLEKTIEVPTYATDQNFQVYVSITGADGRVAKDTGVIALAKSTDGGAVVPV